MSAYQYTNIPGAEFLNAIAGEVGSGENYLQEQHLALKRSRERGAFNQKRFTLQLDDSRQLGYGILLSAPNAVTSLGKYSYEAPRSEAERERVLLQQEQVQDGKQDQPVVDADQLRLPAVIDEAKRKVAEPQESGPYTGIKELPTNPTPEEKLAVHAILAEGLKDLLK